MPTLKEIKNMSAEMFAAEKAASSESSETTPLEVTNALVQFCAALTSSDPQYVPVVDDTHGLYGWCSDGVAEKIKFDGGTHAFGWIVWEWPNAIWTAEFHDVWKNPDGELIDITPKPGGESSILFVYDHTRPQDFNFDNRPRNVRARIYQEADRSLETASVIAKMKPSQKEYEERRATKAGLSLEDWMDRKLPRDRLPTLIDSMINACNEHEAYQDSLGPSGILHADRKILKLMKRRAESLNALKSALASRAL